MQISRIHGVISMNETQRCGDSHLAVSPTRKPMGDKWNSAMGISDPVPLFAPMQRILICRTDLCTDDCMTQSRPPQLHGIAAEDWDLLFRAALELLGRVAVEKFESQCSIQVLQPSGAVLRECLAALDQLRRSVVPEWRDLQSGHNAGAFVWPGPKT